MLKVLLHEMMALWSHSVLHWYILINVHFRTVHILLTYSMVYIHADTYFIISDTEKMKWYTVMKMIIITVGSMHFGDYYVSHVVWDLYVFVTFAVTALCVACSATTGCQILCLQNRFGLSLNRIKLFQQNLAGIMHGVRRTLSRNMTSTLWNYFT